MIKKILLPVLLLFSLLSVAQQSTSSPYSFYGIGDIRFRGTVENRSMGGVGVFPDSIHMNLQNPASYSGLKLSTFTMGGGFNSVRVNSYQGHDKSQRTTMDYLAVGLPVFKSSAIAFGLYPYSAVGYKVRSIDANALLEKRYEGEGGINKAFVGYSYQINKNLSLGAEFNYNFGKVTTNSIQYVIEPYVEFGTQEVNIATLSGANFRFGAMYQRNYKKYDYYASASFTPQSNLSNRNVRSVYSVLHSESNSPGIADKLDDVNTSSTIKMPTQFSIGVGFGQAKKWLLGTEFILKQNGSIDNRFAEINQARFENGFLYSVGGYYIPNYSSFSNYFKKITYRAGFRYEKTGMVIRDEKINDYALTGGFGFPLGGAFSQLNLGVEYGRKGTAKANLVEENYTNVILSFSLNDRWFVRRKID